MNLGYYPGWETGYVRDYLEKRRDDGQRKKAAAKLDFDVRMLVATWPRTRFVTVKLLKGYEPLYELTRDYDGIAYRLFFCVKDHCIWLLHVLEKKRRKTPAVDLDKAYGRMRDVISGQVRSF